MATNSSSSALMPCGYLATFPAAAVSILISVLIVCENVVGVLVIRLNEALHTTANAFVCSMAVTDIGAGLTFFLSSLFTLFQRLDTFPNIDFLPYYSLISMILFKFVIISNCHLAVIAMERYVYIAHPFIYRKRFTWKGISVSLAIFWTASALYTAESLITFSVIPTRDSAVGMVYVVAFNAILYVACTTISGVAYTLIARLAIRRNRFRDKKNQISPREESWKNTLKTVKFFILVFGIFIVLTMPSFIVYVIHIWFSNVPQLIANLAGVLCVSVSSVNFLILSSVNTEFRSALIKTLSVSRCGCH